jgi:hypothetical protein
LSFWIVATVVTVCIYFRGFNTSDAGSISYAEHHLHETLTYLLLLVGNVFPTSFSSPQLELHKIVGFIILLAAGLVVVHSIATWRTCTSIPLPLCLTMFGVMYDVSIAFGRVSLGFAEAAEPRYSMPNLIILTGLACLAFARPTKTWVPDHRKSGALVITRVLITLIVAAVIFGQTALAWDFGTQNASLWRAHIEAGDAVVVNLKTLPEPSRTSEFNRLVFPGLVAATQMHWIQMVEDDKLGELNPGTASQYKQHGRGKPVLAP